MTPPRAMDTGGYQCRASRLKHSIITPVYGGIIPPFIQTPLRCFEKFLCFFKAHVTTISMLLHGCKGAGVPVILRALPKTLRRF